MGETCIHFNETICEGAWGTESNCTMVNHEKWTWDEGCIFDLDCHAFGDEN